MVLSGFSGIATYGIIQCLTNDKNYRDQFDNLYIKFSEFNFADVNILIEVKYKIESSIQNRGSTVGDMRKLDDVKFISLKKI